MSFRVVVVPEDDRLDKYVLRPIVEAACSYIGKPHAKVAVVDNPQPRGISTIMKPEFLNKVINRYRTADLIVYCVDRDAKESRDAEVEHLISHATEVPASMTLGGFTAHQEVEVWCLTGNVRDLSDLWEVVRSEEHPKETYFDPLVKSLNIVNSPGAGRQILGERVAANYQRLRDLSPELQTLEQILISAQ